MVDWRTIEMICFFSFLKRRAVVEGVEDFLLLIYSLLLNVIKEEMKMHSTCCCCCNNMPIPVGSIFSLWGTDDASND